MPSPKKNNHVDPAISSGTSPTFLQPRGLRIVDAAIYSAFSPWYIEEAIRSKILRAVKPEGCRHYVVFREDLDSWMDELREKAA